MTRRLEPPNPSLTPCLAPAPTSPGDCTASLTRVVLRRSLLAVCSLLILLLAAAAPSLYAQETAAGGVRIAVINVELVVAEAREGKELAAFLQQVQTQTRAALEANANQEQSLRQSAVGKGPDELRSIQHQLEDLQRESQRLADDAQRRASKREEEALQQIK